MLEKVLSIRRTIFHSSDEFHELDIHTVNAEVNAGTLTGFQNLVFELFLNFRHDLLDSGRMNTSVHNELVKCKSCDLSSDRIECGKKNSIRSVIHYDFNSGSSLERSDVTSLTSDDTTLDFVVLDREGSNRIFDGSLCGCSLYSSDYYSLSLFSCVKSGIIHSVVDVCLSLASRLSFHVLHEHVLGLLCSHARDVLDLLVRLLPESFVLLDFLLQRIFLRLKASLGIVNVSEAFLEFVVLLVEIILFLLKSVFHVFQLRIFLIYLLFMLTLELEEFLFSLENLLFLDILRLKFCFLDDVLLAAFEDSPVNRYVDTDSNCCCYRCDSDQNQNVHI